MVVVGGTPFLKKACLETQTKFEAEIQHLRLDLLSFFFLFLHELLSLSLE